MILLFRIFRTLLIPNHKCWGSEILKECSPPPMCHMSCVTCHMSHVRCHMSGVTCFRKSGGGSRWRVCYHRGLPRLVYLIQEQFGGHEATFIYSYFLDALVSLFLMIKTDWLTHLFTHWLTDWKVAVPQISQTPQISSLKMECHSAWNVIKNGMSLKMECH